MLQATALGSSVEHVILGLKVHARPESGEQAGVASVGCGKSPRSCIHDCRRRCCARHPRQALCLQSRLDVSEERAEHGLQARPSICKGRSLLGKHRARKIGTMLTVHAMTVEDSGEEAIMANGNNSVCILVHPIFALQLGPSNTVCADLEGCNAGRWQRSWHPESRSKRNAGGGSCGRRRNHVGQRCKAGCGRPASVRWRGSSRRPWRDHTCPGSGPRWRRGSMNWSDNTPGPRRSPRDWCCTGSGNCLLYLHRCSSVCHRR